MILALKTHKEAWLHPKSRQRSPAADRMSEEFSITCPECQEVFSRREAQRRDAHFFHAHRSYLRWSCTECPYKTSTRRRSDHAGHWKRRHFGSPEPPRPVLVKVEEEERRLADEEEKRRYPSPSKGTRVSPRKHSSSSHKRRSLSPEPQHSKRRSTSRAGRRDSPEPGPSHSTAEEQASIRRRSPRKSTSPRKVVRQRSPRKSTSPRKVVRQPEAPHREDSARGMSSGPVPVDDPRPRPSRSSTPELELHAEDEGEFEEAHSSSGARGKTTRPKKSLETRFQEALCFVKEGATQAQAEELVVASEERFPDLRATARRRDRSRLTFLPGGGVGLDSGLISLTCAGPVEVEDLTAPRSRPPPE